MERRIHKEGNIGFRQFNIRSVELAEPDNSQDEIILVESVGDESGPGMPHLLKSCKPPETS